MLIPKFLWGLVLKFRYISYVHFITLPCILLLSLCFGSACTPLTLLLLRYILWCFIDCFRIIFGYSHHTLIVSRTLFILLGRISGSNMFALMFLI